MLDSSLLVLLIILAVARELEAVDEVNRIVALSLEGIHFLGTEVRFGPWSVAGRLCGVLRDQVDHFGVLCVWWRVGVLAMLLVASLAPAADALELILHDLIEAYAFKLEVVLHSQGIIHVSSFEADPAAVSATVRVLREDLDLVSTLLGVDFPMIDDLKIDFFV